MPSPVIVRGNGPREGFPDYIVRMLRRDKVGVFTGLVHRHFKVGAVNQRINPAWLLPEDAPQPWGIPLVDAHAEIGDGMCIVAYRYEGAETAPDIDTSVTYELDTTLAEKPIQTHPDFDRLKTSYGWDEAKDVFAEFIAGGGSAPRDLAGSGTRTTPLPFGDGIATSTALNAPSGGQRRSPLAGIDSYFSVAAIFRKTFAVPADAIPPNILTGIGTIVAAPPGIGQFRIPGTSGKRNWLKMAPKLRNRGNLVEITLEWCLSHPGGWAKALYGAGALAETATE